MTTLPRAVVADPLRPLSSPALGLGTAALAAPSGEAAQDTAEFAAAVGRGTRFLEIQEGTYKVAEGGWKLGERRDIRGAGRGATVLQMAERPQGDMLRISKGASKAALVGITLDYANEVPRRSASALSVASCSEVHLDNVELLHIGNFGLALTAVDRFRARGLVVKRDEPAIAQNQAVLISAAGGRNADLLFEDFWLVNSALNCAAIDARFKTGRIEGWAFGGGLTTELDLANSRRIDASDITFRDGGRAADANAYVPGGLENWAPESIFARMRFYNLGGEAVSAGGAHCLYSDMIAWDCSNGKPLAAFNSRFGGSVEKSGSHSVFSNCIAFETRAGSHRRTPYVYAKQKGVVGDRFGASTGDNISGGLVDPQER